MFDIITDDYLNLSDIGILDDLNNKWGYCDVDSDTILTIVFILLKTSSNFVRHLGRIYNYLLWVLMLKD